MRVEDARLVDLRPPEHERAIRLPCVDVHEEVRVLLLHAIQGPVALGIRHCTAYDGILLLAHAHILLEPLVVLRPVLFVDVVCRAPHGVNRVHTHATLETRSCSPPQFALHHRLLHQVLRGLRDVQKAAHAHASEADRGGQVRVVDPDSERLGHAIHRRPHQGMVDKLADHFAQDDHSEVPSSQGLDVLLCRLDLRLSDRPVARPPQRIQRRRDGRGRRRRGDGCRAKAAATAAA
mmetsp:Transcript_80376/g.260521  ORF Transcript_80376/g.260521 Transcript_80376/m.260521 type:complete len:235 (+) Transcript_80376:1076-1780(+)